MRYGYLTLVLLFVLAVFRVCYITWGPFDISPDEAHYWEWSRRLDLSYYSKGPGVAYVIALFTSIFGVGELGIRIGAVLFSAAASFTLYLLGKALFKSGRVGFYSALLPNLTPIFSVGSILMTTDIMLVFFWAAASLSIYRAATESRPALWVLGGAFIGLGFLAKYTMVLLVPCLVLFFLVSKAQRRWILRPEPYVAGLVSLVFATPVILWNIINGQVTIRHTMGQAHLGEGALSLVDGLEFVGAQAALLTPLVFGFIAYGVWRSFSKGLREKRDELLFVFFTSAPIFAFFVVKSLHGKVQANWAVASFVTAFPAAVWALSELYERRRRPAAFLAAAAVVMGLVFSLLAYFPWLLEPLGAKKVLTGPPYNRVIGWEELGADVTRIRGEMGGDGALPFVVSDAYQIASELALYVEGNPVVYNVNTGKRRMNQYDLWPGPVGLEGLNAVYVKGDDAALDPAVNDAFTSCEKELVESHWGERAVKKFTAFRCYGFKGFRAGAIESY